MKGWPGEPQMAYDELMARDAAATAEREPITQVIFDFGNVLLYWNPEAVMIPRYSQRLVDGFLDNDISSFYDANDLMDAGASLEEGVAYVREHKGEPWASMMRYYVDNFRDSLTGVVTGARVLIDDLHAAGIGVWGLSNWQQELYHIAGRDGAARHARRQGCLGPSADAQAEPRYLRVRVAQFRHSRAGQRVY